MQTDLSGPEKFWYYLVCVFTFGGLYFMKLAVKKGLCELNAAAAAHQYNNSAYPRMAAPAGTPPVQRQPPQPQQPVMPSTTETP
jgi:hypothetical protein